MELYEEAEGFEEAHIYRRSVVSSSWYLEPAEFEFLQTLCESLPRRTDAIWKAKGVHSKCWLDLDFTSLYYSMNFLY